MDSNWTSGRQRDASWDLARMSTTSRTTSRDSASPTRGPPPAGTDSSDESRIGSSTDAPTSVLDAGCGIGLLVGALRDRGVDAYGLDVSRFALSQVPAWLATYCGLGSVTDELPRTYDLIACIEVLEHIPSEMAEEAIANFARHTDRVLFSSSPDDVE